VAFDVDRAIRDTAHRTRISILNVARMGKFSSDRALRAYAEKIWKVEPPDRERTVAVSLTLGPIPRAGVGVKRCRYATLFPKGLGGQGNLSPGNERQRVDHPVRTSPF
jgi:hypothetical protein